MLSLILSVPLLVNEFVTPLKSRVCPIVVVKLNDPAPLNVTVPVVYPSIVVIVEEANVPVSVILKFSFPSSLISAVPAAYNVCKFAAVPLIDVTADAPTATPVFPYNPIKSLAVTLAVATVVVIISVLEVVNPTNVVIAVSLDVAVTTPLVIPATVFIFATVVLSDNPIVPVTLVIPANAAVIFAVVSEKFWCG